jgi:ABC-type phosphate/phosphonate transport system substrate-binding protein
MAHMSEFIAALPMYDWPEARSETDALWSGIRDLLRKQGIGAPEKLVRSNADMPPVKGGIRDAAGQLIAPDPAELPSDDLDMHVLWRHPKLLFAQACWGPMELGLAGHVRVVGQPDYSAFEGGQGELYSSAILMRRSGKGIGAPGEGGALIPRDLLRGKRLAFNSPDSMSGIIALTRDLAALGENPEIFSERIETGSHRASAVAVARGEADVCAVDCRTWDLIRRFEPAAAEVEVVGWTARRRGLPYISSLSAPRFSSGRVGPQRGVRRLGVTSKRDERSSR